MSAATDALTRLRPDVAFQPWFPSGANPWNATRVAHLLRRAAFGAPMSVVEAGAKESPDVLIDRLLRPDESRVRAFDAECARLEEGVLASNDPRQLKGLWLYRMVNSPHPLQERLTLFWHDHFATSNAKVNDVRAMQQQVATLRRHALGHFGEMLQEMTRDPAMLVWLDSNTNKKGHPNENYAREVFELFSLGVSNYTEKDIQEAARALTGWSVRDGRAVFTKSEFDAGEKTILGQTGRWGAGDVVRIALMQKSCGRFLVKKLFAEFVSETVELPPEYLDPLAEELRIRDYDIGWLMSTLLRSWVFYSPAAIGQRIKSPIEFLVGAVRTLDGPIGPVALADFCDQLGQSPFYPPSVKGWDGGTKWLNSTTLLFRQNIAFDLTRGDGPARRCDPARLASKHRLTGDESIAAFFLSLFHQNPEHESLPQIIQHLQSERIRRTVEGFSSTAIDGLLCRTAAHLAMTMPEYQLA
ncbi:MAG: DUF1800 domain-containing protein [Planctomycetaceae bacterium]|nr:DUF1800 domain-containing protein [Planctomycetaceae bacterium]